jgi:hypothetical protein
LCTVFGRQNHARCSELAEAKKKVAFSNPAVKTVVKARRTPPTRTPIARLLMS